MAKVKFFCGECKKDFGSNSSNHSKGSIHNLLKNFKKSQIISMLHDRACYKKGGVTYEDHPQTKTGNLGYCSYDGPILSFGG